MRFDPHSQNNEATMRFDPHSSQAAPAPADSEATEFGSNSSGAGIGTQKFEPGHNSGALPFNSNEPNAQGGSTTSKGGTPRTSGSGARAHSSGGRRHSTHRSIIRKFSKGPVLVTIIGMLLIAIVAFFTMFDDVWYNIR